VIPDFYIEEMRKIAHEWDCNLELDGEVGFGRRCVGISDGMNYVDFSMYAWAFRESDPVQREKWERLSTELHDIAPTGAYHKHDCLAVLGINDEAQMQLYTWVTELKLAGWTVMLLPEYDTGGTSVSQFLYGRRGKIPTLIKEEA
jgi:hypothetical protein